MGGIISNPALILEASTGNIGGCYVSHLFLGLMALVLEPSRAFHCLYEAFIMPKQLYVVYFEVL